MKGNRDAKKNNIDEKKSEDDLEETKGAKTALDVEKENGLSGCKLKWI